MAVIWGLDMKEFQWNKFGSKNMWNNVYHLRRTKFIVFQIAMIFCVVSESLGTAALSDYVDEQKFIASLDNHALEYNNDYVGAASYNIFAGIFVATIFGAAFFFDLLWPERYESPSVRLAWKICSVLACVFYLASALALTVITATRSAYITGVGSERATQLLQAYAGSPLIYHHNGRAIAAVVFSWPGFIATVASAYLLIVAKNHDEAFGPFSTHVREARAKDPEMNLGNPLTEKDAHPAGAPTRAVPAHATSEPHEQYQTAGQAHTEQVEASAPPSNDNSNSDSAERI